MRSAVLTALLVLGALSPVQAERPAAALPAQVPAAERVRLEPIVKNAAVATRMELERYGARPAIFEYLLDHPEFATYVTRALRAARYRIWRTPAGLFLDDGWGAHGHFEVVYAQGGMRVFFAHGQYEQRMLPDLSGRAVVVLEYGFHPGADGRPTVATAVTAHLALDGRILGMAGRAAAPMVQKKADREGHTLLRVFSKVSRAIEDNPQAVYDRLRALEGVPRRELEEFRKLLLRVP